jgi:hypothetical protein
MTSPQKKPVQLPQMMGAGGGMGGGCGCLLALVLIAMLATLSRPQSSSLRS